MKIRVYPPANADPAALDERGYMELPEGARLRDLHRALGIPPLARPFLFCAVNYKISGPRRALKDGDTVSYFAMVRGG